MSKYFLSQYVKGVRTRAGLTQEQFANELGIGFSTLKQAELGNTSVPQKEFLIALSNYQKEKPEKVLVDILYYNYRDYANSNEYIKSLFL